MRKLLIIITLFQTIHLFGQPLTYQEKATALLQTAVSEKQVIGIAGGFSVNGQIKWQDGAGYRDEKNKQAFDTNTITRIASVTKIMTAIAILQLYEQGRLKLDEPIQTYLPSFPQKKEGEMTIRQLLQHSSGMDEYKNNKEQENKTNYETLADAVSIFKDRDLISIPGQAFHYTTYGYVVLGMIVEKVSGTTFKAFLQTNIWDKAKMAHTGIEYADSQVPNTAQLYHKNSKGKLSDADRTNLSDRIPGGGVYSTVTDMLKFGDGLMNHSFINDSTFTIMTADPHIKHQGNGYGMGLYLYGKNPAYGFVYGHNGAQTGASTFLMILPEQNTSIVVLSNTSGAMQTVTNITIKLFDIAAGS